MWQGRSRTGGDADDCAPPRGLCEEARLAERSAASARAGRRAPVCAWGAVRAAAEGRRERGGGKPSPPVAAPGAAPLRAWDRRAPAAAARWRDSRPAPRPPASAADSASWQPGRRFSRAPGLGSAEGEEMSAAAAPERGWKSEKVDEAQALARSCAARRPDFQPCDGLSICATHSHGKCFKLHWCCHLGWCHCKSGRRPRRSPRSRGRPAGSRGVPAGALRPPVPGWAPGARGRGLPSAGRLGVALPRQRHESPWGTPL